MKFTRAICVIAVVAVLGGIVYAGWHFTRTVNYKASYKSMVEETVRDMVKEEALKEQEGK